MTEGIAVTLENLVVIAERDENNNPIWKLPTVVKVHRQDNSLSISEHVGTLSSDEVHADVSHIYGGFVFGLSVKRKTKKGKVYGDVEHYAVDCRPVLEQVVGLNLEFRKVPRLPRPPRPAKRRGGKKKRKTTLKEAR